MDYQGLLDSTPLWGVFLGFAIIALIAYEVGFRIGRWWQDRTLDEKEGPTGMLVGSILALMAFLLAVTMGMAADRFDARRGLVLAESNAVGTTYLRAGYLPEPAATDSRELLREYVPLRIISGETEVTAANVMAQVARSGAILDELWLIAEELARTTPDSEVLALYIDSLNETIDVSSMRLTAGLYARVPQTVMLLLIFGSALTLGMVGYSAGLSRRRSLLTAVMLIVVLGAVITLIVDIDRPQGGTLRVSQQPLIDLQSQVGPPGS